MMKKLKSSLGESLSEALVSVLIIALAILMLVSMLTASERLITKSTSSFHSNMEVKNSVENGGASDTSDGTVSFSDGALSDGKSGKSGKFSLDSKNKALLQSSEVSLQTYDDITVTYTNK